MVIKASTAELYKQYKELIQNVADINYASAVLGWDQEVYMPANGFAYRGRQLATLASMAHELSTGDEYGQLLEELSNRGDITDIQAANIRLSKEDYEKQKKLPTSLVQQLTNQVSKSYQAWIEARKSNDYKIYAPELQKMLQLVKEKANVYGYEGHVYDALLDEYEKGATVAQLDPIFEQVKEKLPTLLDKIKEATQVDDTIMYQYYPRKGQWDFSIDVLKAMGYDFDSGRQDISEHPFTTSFAPTDVRITTRVDENDFASLLWSSIHEGGHALYEQGLPEDQYGMPLGEAASLSIHESQSRIWENNVGRGMHFWHHFYPKLQSYFPEQLKNTTEGDFYKAMNKVQPSLIRTEADELTYHFHVLIRYEVEKGLLEGVIKVEELNQVWNEMYQKYLGVSADNDKEGVLQDVHWAHGSFGYFPTYSLGSFYAAQFYNTATKQIDGLEEQFAAGKYGEFHQWLKEKVHRHGRHYRSDELCQMITGQGLDINSFIQYASQKYQGIYSL